MKKILAAAAAAAFLLGTQAALANDDQATAKDKTSASVGVKHKRSTTGAGVGIGPENNASAKGSLLPGKDRAASRAFIKDK